MCECVCVCVCVLCVHECLCACVSVCGCVGLWCIEMNKGTYYYLNSDKAKLC